MATAATTTWARPGLSVRTETGTNCARQLAQAIQTTDQDAAAAGARHRVAADHIAKRAARANMIPTTAANQ